MFQGAYMRLHVKILMIFCSFVQLMQGAHVKVATPGSVILGYHQRALQLFENGRQSYMTESIDSGSTCGTNSIKSSPEPEESGREETERALELRKRMSFTCETTDLGNLRSLPSITSLDNVSSPLTPTGRPRKNQHPTTSPSDHGTVSPSDVGATPIKFHPTKSPSDAGATPIKFHPTKSPSDAGSPCAPLRQPFSRKKHG